MTEELSTAVYCEVCGIDINSNTNLKRFGKLFCSEGHMDQYVKSRQRVLGLENGTSEKERGEEPRRRRNPSC